ncbi:MAG: M23 family metallopeptidase [Clostridia bacterium]
MNKFQNVVKSVGKFLKKNIYYVLIVVCIAAIGTMVTVALTKNDAGKNNAPAVVTPGGDKPVVKPDDKDPIPSGKPDPIKPTPVIFISPIANAEAGLNYSETELVFSKTLEQYSTHSGIDFIAAEGTAVNAVYDGVVSNIQNDVLYGYTVTINHKDGVSTRYSSLGEAINVKVGQTVKQGEKIGVTSTSMILESSDGAHLHFETMLNNIVVNPNEYFITSEK